MLFFKVLSRKSTWYLGLLFTGRINPMAASASLGLLYNFLSNGHVRKEPEYLINKNKI